MLINIKTIEGKIIPFTVYEEESVQQLLLLIEQKVDILAENIEIVNKGETLNRLRTVWECGVNNGDTLELKCKRD